MSQILEMLLILQFKIQLEMEVIRKYILNGLEKNQLDYQKFGLYNLV